MGRALFPQAISRGSCRSRVGIMTTSSSLPHQVPSHPILSVLKWKAHSVPWRWARLLPSRLGVWFERKWSPKGSGTIRRYGFAGVGAALLEEACHHGGGL